MLLLDAIRSTSRRLHDSSRTKEADLHGIRELIVPHAVRKKMPCAAMSLAWQYLFPTSRPCTAPTTGRADRDPPGMLNPQGR